MTEITVKIDLEAYKKMMGYADLIDAEYIGFLVIEQEDNDIIVKDVILPYQKVTSGDCEFDDTMFSVITENKNINPEKIKGWIHSHNNMEVFWSSTDEDTIKKLGRRMPFVVSIVVNKEHKMKTRVDIFRPFRVTLDDVTTKIDFYNKEFLEELKKEVDERVEIASYTYRKECPYRKKKNYHECKYASYSACPYNNPECPKINKYGRWYDRDYDREEDFLSSRDVCPFLGIECYSESCDGCAFLEETALDGYVFFEYRGKNCILYYWREGYGFSVS